MRSDQEAINLDGDMHEARRLISGALALLDNAQEHIAAAYLAQALHHLAQSRGDGCEGC